MESKRYGREIVLRLDDGEELLTGVEQTCKAHGVCSARISGIGASKSVRLRVVNENADGFVFKDIEENREIASITGNITLSGDVSFLHLHLTAADRTMQLVGGHVVQCIISNTAEIWITETENGTVRRAETAEGLLRKIEFDTSPSTASSPEISATPISGRRGAR